MNNWHDFIDGVFVINLAHRIDRKMDFSDQMRKHHIRFELFDAVKRNDGREGIYHSMFQLLQSCLYRGYKNVLVFEDDAEIIHPQFEAIFTEAVRELPDDYDMLYLGINHTVPFLKFYSDFLLPVCRGFSLHAVLWSESGMKKFVSMPMQLPIDTNMATKIQKDGKCFAVYPTLVSQKPGMSDIEHRPTYWRHALETRFTEQTKHLLTK
jgi:GR25 family glycosyltransferase involved in LPS biosynthesis